MKRLALLASLAALPSCVAASGASSSALSDSEWQMLAIDGDAAANLDQAKLSFSADTLGASVGCNRMGGNYRVKDDRLIAGPLNRTEMYCEGPVGGQEQALSALLVAAPEIRLSNGRLTLISSGHRAEFARVDG
jgi:heat shock protein HslJ